jgi:hypothetical protein
MVSKMENITGRRRIDGVTFFLCRVCDHAIADLPSSLSEIKLQADTQPMVQKTAFILESAQTR